MSKEDAVKMVIVVRKDLNMRKGKMGAQCGHASGMFMMSPFAGGRRPRCDWTDTELQWFNTGTTKIVLGVDHEHELHEIMNSARRAGLAVHPVTDSGRTEFHGEATLTCCAIGPDLAANFDKITGDLKPL